MESLGFVGSKGNPMLKHIIMSASNTTTMREFEPLDGFKFFVPKKLNGSSCAESLVPIACNKNGINT
jgi:hypothetical protein